MAEEGTKIEQPSEALCLPIKKDAVKRALGEIADNPDKVIEEEDIILAKDSELTFLIYTGIKAYGTNKEYSEEGALLTLRIIRTQGEMNKASIPTASKEARDVYAKDFTDALKALGPKGSMRWIIEEKRKQMELEDPELGNALKELFKYRAGKVPLYAGAVAAYFPIRQITQGIMLERRLGLRGGEN